jgi:Arc/MetJ-type ribon-helix-helix transcriptional regulator
MLQDEDDRRIDILMRRLKITRKVDIVRAALTLLEKKADRRDRILRWKRAAAMAAATSREVNADFQPYSSLKRS